MYAVVKTGGRQYKVSPGESFSVEKLDAAPGSTIQIKEVLMVGGDQTLLGAPFVNGATVTVVVEEQYRGQKVLVYKKKRRHKYRKMRGHRSELTRLFVSEIATPNGSLKAENKPHVLEGTHLSRQADKKAKAPEAGGEAKAAKPAAKKAAGGTKKASAKSTGTKKSATKSKSKK